MSARESAASSARREPCTAQRDRVLGLFAGAAAAAAQESADRRVRAIATSRLGSARVAPDVSVRVLKERFAASVVPAGHTDVDAYLDHLARDVVPASSHMASPRSMAHMTSVLPHFMLPLNRLMLLLNQNMVKLDASMALTPYERQVVAMMHRLTFRQDDAFYAAHAQHDQSTLGMMVSGGTIANLTALWCARNAALGARDAVPRGGAGDTGVAAALAARGYRSAAVVGSALMHYSFAKAMDVLGLGAENLVRVETDAHNRVSVPALRRALEGCRARGACVVAVVGVAGSTAAGSVDPLDEMARVAHDAGVHFHVDAAWGGALLFSERHRGALAGIERADSVTLDGHKQLFLPIGSSMVLLRDPQLGALITHEADYAVRPGSPDLGRRALEGSRAGTALFWHAALHIIGREGFALIVDENLARMRYMADQVAARPEFELLSRPEAGIVLYRFVPARWRDALAGGGELTAADNDAISAFNVRLQRAQRQAGRSCVSRSTIASARHATTLTALRAVVLNPLAETRDIDAVLDDQVAVAATLP